MNKKAVHTLFFIKLPGIAGGFLFCMLMSCGNKDALNIQQLSAVQDSVRIMTEMIATDVTRQGPTAWLKYFENSPAFFMASDGEMLFPNYDSASNFINHVLVKSIDKINLKWSNVRIDPLTYKFAGVSATFHEDITLKGGNKLPQDGYFTAVAEQTSARWRLRNAHWSIIHQKQGL